MLNFLSRLLGKKHPVSQTVPEKKQEPSASQDEKLKALRENILKLGLKNSADVIADEVIKLAWRNK